MGASATRSDLRHNSGRQDRLSALRRGRRCGHTRRRATTRSSCGLLGYVYDQLSCDSGSGNRVDCKLAERYGLIDEGDEAPFTDAKLDIIKAPIQRGAADVEDVLKHIIGVYNHFRDRKQWDGAFEI